MEKIKEVIIMLEKDKGFHLGYFLSQKNNLYGVSAELARNGVVVDYEYVPNLWETRDTAVGFINFLAKNSVTPTTLVEVLDEFMG